MYAFAQRGDTRVIDEPLYAHYLRHQPTGAEHPGRTEILGSQENDGDRVIDWLLGHPFGTEVVVAKQMTHHLVGLTNEVAILGLGGPHAARVYNVLLIRDPRAILASFGKVVAAPTAADVGFPQQYRLYQRLAAAGKLTAILDARRLLLDPAGTLQKLCEKLAVPYDSNMLSWPAGARPEDGIWAKYWYANVHQSTGFGAYRPKTYDLPPELEAIARAAEPAYAEMLDLAL